MRNLLFIALVVAGCTRATYLAPNDLELVRGTKREATFIVVRQDGGMPRADRLLADDACKNMAKLLQDAKNDAGAPCP